MKLMYYKEMSMKPINELIAGLFGTGSCAVGTALQTNEVLQTISMIITILGGIVTLIVLPILNWYHKAKQDGEITEDELKEGQEILEDGLDKLNKKGNKKDENKK